MKGEKKLTELLYLKDSYIKEFSCTVSEIVEEENAIILNRTAFYPGGGGQPCDIGKLVTAEGIYTVTKVKKIAEKIYHYIEGKLPAVNEECKGELDWENRYKLMRTHTAMHLLSGLIWNDYAVQVTGGNMEPLKARMDFEFADFAKELIAEIEEKADREIANKRDIRTAVMAREEAFKIPDLIRTKINLLPAGIEQIRTVEIVGLDLQADGGTHVQNTSEIGKIRIVDYKSKGKINKRLYVEISD